MPAVKDPDADMVQRARAGDQAAFEYLVLKYQGRIQSLIRRYLRDDDQAVADTAQEAFINAWKAMRKFQGKSRFYTWLYSIAVNTAKNSLSTRSRRQKMELPEPNDWSEDMDVPDEDSLSAEEQLIADRDRRAVEQAMRQISGTLREALCLREYEELSYEEIAKVLDCPVNTVRTRIFRARAALAKLLDNGTER